MSKYPGLARAARRNGIAYMTAYQRMNYGWSFERATTEPTHKAKPKPMPLAYTPARQHVDELFGAPKARKRRAERKPNDSSPPHIQALRAAFCDEFAKTGVINTELQSQLKEYADERRAAKNNSHRVPADPEAQRHRGRSPRVGDNGVGDRPQTGPGAGEHARNFIRS